MGTYKIYYVPCKSYNQLNIFIFMLLLNIFMDILHLDKVSKDCSTYQETRLLKMSSWRKIQIFLSWKPTFQNEHIRSFGKEEKAPLLKSLPLCICFQCKTILKQHIIQTEFHKQYSHWVSSLNLIQSQKFLTILTVS